MNDPRQPEPHEQLFTEVFHEDWTGGPAADFARAAAASVRRRRAGRRTLASTAALAVVAAAFVFAPGRRSAASRLPPPSPASVTPARVAPPAYEIISDEEFVAEVSDRPLLVLPQEDGTKKVVLLDR